ncbi:hypothetical protein CY652_01650 [Burkholderia sp. WAC0059]|uniref:hypothetical protein n=1 Tax=Burkholderia sp. WAC0059 TaxID=2066022 RepID=UPI000C7F20CC|nr:hypothetical protein [Burkholderia sp. WAC0059]PLZ04391.1 hypothetical protein CY652_01650 [Burkholderia sp. WAC0059]
MPILVLLLAFVALVYGAVRAFDTLAARFGTDVAIGAAVVVAAALAVALAAFLRRRRDVAANLHDGDWTHGLSDDWGEIRLAADKRLCDVRVGATRGSYIFADLQGARPEREGAGWRVALRVSDRGQPLWLLPMRSEREAKRWARILTLAIAQRL